MSAILNTKRAVERKLSTLNIPMAVENVDFIPSSSIYIYTQFVVRSPEDPTIGDNYYLSLIHI